MQWLVGVASCILFQQVGGASTIGYISYNLYDIVLENMTQPLFLLSNVIDDTSDFFDSFQDFEFGQIESPTCPHCGIGDKTAEHLLLFCPKWAVERQRYFGDSIDITDVLQDYESLVEFLISSGHLSPHIGSA